MQTSRFTLSLFLITMLFSAQTAIAHGNGQALPGNNHNAKALMGVLDSTLIWNWGTSSYNQLAQGSFNTYGTNNMVSNTVNMNYSGGSWINYTQDNYGYDGNNNLLSDVNQHWSGTAWVNFEQYTSTYDGNNNQLSNLVQLWTSGAWANNTQYFYHYNVSNVLTSNIMQTWVSGAWVTTDSFVYTYDGNNNLMNELDLNWSGTAWVNNNQWVYTYSGNNKVTYTIQTWTGSAWSNESVDNYTYSGGNLATDINQVYNGNIASNNQELFYGYDSYNNNTSIVNEQYVANAWTDYDSTHLYYHETGTVNSVVNVNTLDAVISVYPNPAQSVINVSVSNSTIQPLLATLYDITGRALKTIPLNNNVTQVSLNNISAGVYELVLADEKGNKAVKQIVVQ